MRATQIAQIDGKDITALPPPPLNTCAKTQWIQWNIRSFRFSASVVGRDSLTPWTEPRAARMESSESRSGSAPGEQTQRARAGPAMTKQPSYFDTAAMEMVLHARKEDIKIIGQRNNNIIHNRGR